MSGWMQSGAELVRERHNLGDAELGTVRQGNVHIRQPVLLSSREQGAVQVHARPAGNLVHDLDVRPACCSTQRTAESLEDGLLACETDGEVFGTLASTRAVREFATREDRLHYLRHFGEQSLDPPHLDDVDAHPDVRVSPFVIRHVPRPGQSDSGR